MTENSRLAVVTGGAQGLGLGIADRLLRDGYRVAIVDIQSAPEVSLRGAVGLVEEQLACIAAQGCSGSVSLPGSIFGTRDRPAE